jgi:hypothetical protein
LTLRWGGWFLLIYFIAGCGPGTIPADTASLSQLLHFIADNPSHPQKTTLIARVERLRWRACREADRPLAYRRFLELHRKGRFATEARTRLAELALGRAKTIAQLDLVIERYRGSEAARVAEKRLAQKMAQQALGARDLSLARTFVSRYPRHPQAASLREKLAKDAYRGLPNDPRALTGFAQRFRSTAFAKKAMDRAKTIWVKRLRRFPSQSALAALIARFPELERDEGLLVHVSRSLARSRVARLQLSAARTLAAWISSRLGAKNELLTALETLRQGCKDSRRCTNVRRLALAALPYETTAKLERLESEVRHADLLRGWQAMAHLARHPAARSGDTLLELASEPRLANVWVAWRQLKIWLSRLPAPTRRSWLRGVFSRLFRRRDAKARLSVAVLELLRGKTDSGLARLGALRHPRYRLVVFYYLLELHRGGFGSCPRCKNAAGQISRAASRAAFLQHARKRLRALEGAFPKRLDTSSLTAASLAERQLFMLSIALSRGLLYEQARALLASWRRLVLGRFAGFKLASLAAYRLDALVARHAKGRLRALARLVSRRGKLETLVARAVCAQLAQSNAAITTPCKRRFKKGYAPF